MAPPTDHALLSSASILSLFGMWTCDNPDIDASVCLCLIGPYAVAPHGQYAEHLSSRFRFHAVDASTYDSLSLLSYNIVASEEKRVVLFSIASIEQYCTLRGMLYPGAFGRFVPLMVGSASSPVTKAYGPLMSSVSDQVALALCSHRIRLAMPACVALRPDDTEEKQPILPQGYMDPESATTTTTQSQLDGTFVFDDVYMDLNADDAYDASETPLEDQQQQPDISPRTLDKISFRLEMLGFATFRHDLSTGPCFKWQCACTTLMQRGLFVGDTRDDEFVFVVAPHFLACGWFVIGLGGNDNDARANGIRALRVRYSSLMNVIDTIDQLEHAVLLSSPVDSSTRNTMSTTGKQQHTERAITPNPDNHLENITTTACIDRTSAAVTATVNECNNESIPASSDVFYQRSWHSQKPFNNNHSKSGFDMESDTDEYEVADTAAIHNCGRTSRLLNESPYFLNHKRHPPPEQDCFARKKHQTQHDDITESDGNNKTDSDEHSSAGVVSFLRSVLSPFFTLPSTQNTTNASTHGNEPP